MSKTPPQWPFTPSLLDSIPEQVAQLFRELEMYLLNEICSRIKATAQMNEVAVGAYRALRAHGIKTADIDKEIQKRVQQAGVKFKDVMKDVVNWNQQYYTNTINAAGLTQPDSLVDESDIKAIEDQCYEQFSNLTRSMGFYYGGELLKNPGEVYQHVMDSAVLKIQSGATSYNEAIRSAIIELADGGLRVVDYESGHVDRIDVAVRRAVRTGSAQLNAKYREQGVDYLKTDLVEVTAHYGARDQGVGPENHESWQGKWYRWSEKPRTSKGNYPDFVTTTGYKTGEGLLGWNCRHSFYSVIEGVHMPTYTKEQLEAMKGKNRKKVKYQGKEYTDYEASQFQRKLERSIRKYLRRQNAAKAAGLDDDAAAFGARVQALRRQYKEFSKAAGLPEQMERTHVYTQARTGNSSSPSGGSEPSGTSGTAQKYSSASLLRGASSGSTIGDGKSCADYTLAYEDLSKRFKDKFGVTIGSEVGALDKQSVVEALTGTETVLDDFPELQRYFKGVGLVEEKYRIVDGMTTLMSCGPDGIIRFNPGVFIDRETAIRWNNNGPVTGYMPKNTTCFGTGVHEAGHLFEKALMRKNGSDFKLEDWTSSKYSARMIREISESLKERGVKTNIVELRVQISKRAKYDFGECLSDAICDWYTNGENSSFLSKEIISYLKRSF